MLRRERMTNRPDKLEEERVSDLDDLISDLLETAGDESYMLELLDLLLREFPEHGALIREVAAEFPEQPGQG